MIIPSLTYFFDRITPKVIRGLELLFVYRTSVFFPVNAHDLNECLVLEINIQNEESL